MDEPLKVPPEHSAVLRLAAGEDLFNEQRGLTMSSIHIKVSMPDASLLILENTFQAKGGPPRHLHFDQDEWFYALEGRFIVEVGQERIALNPGDSLLAPRKVPHVWAHVAEGHGRILIAFTPAGKMEAFFRNVMKTNVMPPREPQLWLDHGMELLGPPLALD